MSRPQVFFAIAGLCLALAGLLMRLASTHPDTAVSNLSEWAKKCGLHKIPPWLSDKQADEITIRWARVILAISFVVIILSGAVWYWSPNKEASPASTQEEILPGFGAGMAVSISDVTENRRKYQFSFHTKDGAKA